MRSLFAVLSVVVAFALPAFAEEKRTFIIAGNSDGYGIDRCLATGASCGAAVARAYCRARDYAQAIAYRKAELSEIAGTSPACSGSACEQYVAIECTR
jgi:hypothetical protein